MKYADALFIFIAVFLFSNCKAMKPDSIIVITFSENKQGASITAHKGDTLQVKLPMNSGTGYVWELSNKPHLCIQSNTEYEDVKKRLPGATMNEVVNLRIAAKGQEDIIFIYHRPFEKNLPPAKTKTLHLIIQ